MKEKRRRVRAKIREGLMLIWVLAFPLTLYYFSPYLPLSGMAEGVVSGSLVIFALLFLTSTILGRLFCGWICPAGSIQHFAARANSRRLPRRRLHLIKYFLVWFPWLGGLVALFLNRSGPLRVDLLYQTEGGISVARPEAYIIYGAVLLLIAGLALLVGKRAACHTVCWMAPFMVLGSSLGKLMRLPQLGMKATAGSCVGCGACVEACPMGLEVSSLIRGGRVDHYDCILCGACADICPKSTLRYSFSRKQSGLSRKAKTAVTATSIFLLSSCSVQASPRLVPPTVLEDASLPRVTVSVGGHDRLVHYRTYGDPSAPPVFVMPGSVSDMRAYLSFQALADQYYVILWDQRGQGLSERVDRDELSFEDMVEEIEAMRRLFTPDKKITLIGHSWSAVFAALYGATYPEALQHLVLIEPFGFTSEIMKALTSTVNLMTPGYLDMAWISEKVSATDHDSLDFRVRGMLTSGVRPFFKDPKHLPYWPVWRVGGLALLTWEGALYENGVWKYDLTDGFDRIGANILLVGSEYSFIGYDFQMRWNAPLFTGASSLRGLLIPDSGHRIITENWTALETGLRNFLEERQ